MLLYGYASTRYDGGSKVHPHRKSWDWINNYWCDLIWPTTILGLPNRAARWGVVANLVLCLSCLFFFIALALAHAPSAIWSWIIMVCGTLTMVFSTLLPTPWHDRIITWIVVSAIPAAIGVVYTLLHAQIPFALSWGGVALAAIAVNVYIFYTTHGQRALPFVQKVAFVIVLSWVYYVNTTIE